MNSEPYWVPADAVVFEEEIKKVALLPILPIRQILKLPKLLLTI